MKNIIFIVIPIFLGTAACIYALTLLASGGLEVAGKYSPEGRDFNTMLLAVIIGISLLLYGFSNWFINRSNNSGKN